MATAIIDSFNLNYPNGFRLLESRLPKRKMRRKFPKRKPEPPRPASAKELNEYWGEEIVEEEA